MVPLDLIGELQRYKRRNVHNLAPVRAKSTAVPSSRRVTSEESAFSLIEHSSPPLHFN
jgi:hypothetical protein